MSQKLIKACRELALESFEWMKIKKERQDKGTQITDEELAKLTQKGAWEKYLKAGGSRTMINEQLSEEDDFIWQYKRFISSFRIENKEDCK